jgi:hypothetical protein
MIVPHASHRFGFVDGLRCCLTCYCEPDWPLAEQRCSSLGKTGHEEDRPGAHAPRRRRSSKHVAADDILALLKSGASIAEIQRTLRVSNTRVSAIAKLYKIPTRAQGSRAL